MFIPLKMVLIGIDLYPYVSLKISPNSIRWVSWIPWLEKRRRFSARRRRGPPAVVAGGAQRRSQWDGSKMGSWNVGNPWEIQTLKLKHLLKWQKKDREGRFFELRRIDMNDHNWTCDAKRQVEVFLGVASSPWKCLWSCPPSSLAMGTPR